MKIKFDPNLDFQKQAIESVAGVFEGQEICQTNFTVAPLQSLPSSSFRAWKTIWVSETA